jgi:hypothetical protein
MARISLQFQGIFGKNNSLTSHFVYVLKIVRSKVYIWQFLLKKFTAFKGSKILFLLQILEYIMMLMNCFGDKN